MGAEDITAGGEVVYLLAELRSAEQGPVYEIGSRARVLEADGDRLTLAVGYGRFESVVTCSRATRRPAAAGALAACSPRRPLVDRLTAAWTALAVQDLDGLPMALELSLGRKHLRTCCFERCPRHPASPGPVRWWRKENQGERPIPSVSR